MHQFVQVIPVPLLVIFYLQLKQHQVSDIARMEDEAEFPYAAWCWAAVTPFAHYYKSDFVLV